MQPWVPPCAIAVMEHANLAGSCLSGSEPRQRGSCLSTSSPTGNSMEHASMQQTDIGEFVTDYDIIPLRKP